MTINEEFADLFAETRRANEAQRLADNAAKTALREQIEAAHKVRLQQIARDERARFESDLRESFFLANPMTNGDDWERLKGAVFDARMLEAAAAQQVNQFARIRAENPPGAPVSLDGRLGMVSRSA